MELVKIGQPNVSPFAIIISKKAVHWRVRWNRAEHKFRPINGLILVAMVHQPTSSMAAKLQIKGIAFKLAGNFGKLVLVLANLVKCSKLLIGLLQISLSRQNEHCADTG